MENDFLQRLDSIVGEIDLTLVTLEDSPLSPDRNRLGLWVCDFKGSWDQLLGHTALQKIEVYSQNLPTLGGFQLSET